jgi:hypothetical protein
MNGGGTPPGLADTTKRWPREPFWARAVTLVTGRRARAAPQGTARRRKDPFKGARIGDIGFDPGNGQGSTPMLRPCALRRRGIVGPLDAVRTVSTARADAQGMKD